MKERLRRLLVKVRNKGARGTLRAVARRAWHLPANLLRRAWALFAGASWSAAVLSLRALRVRFFAGDHLAYSPTYTHIGHMAVEPDCFIKEGRLGLRPKVRGVMLAPAGKVVNLSLLNYWRRHLWVITSPFWCRLLKPIARLPALCWSANSYVVAHNGTARFGEIQSAWGQRPPVLRLTSAHRRAGEARLREMGVPAGAWIVCVHCREGGYDGHHRHHTLRNAAIENYIPAMEAIAERGGWCVRMGDPTMRPLRPLPGVIDYAHSPLRCDWMDVFLCASGKFFLGSASGLYAVASVFGVPSAVANQILPSLTHPLGINDVLIPKLLWSSERRRYLTFSEIAKGPFANARYPHCFAPTDVVAHENTPADILDLALEMLDQVEGRLQESAEDHRLQQAYQALIQPGHYSYGAASRIGRRFLRKYRHLLNEPPGEDPLDLRLTPGCGTVSCPCLTPGWKPPLCA